jgi:predicted permease
MGALWQDVRYGLRMLARSPGFTALVVAILAVGIGANTALFNALDQVYARPLPVRKPGELVSVQCHLRLGLADRVFETMVPEFDYSTYEVFRDRPGVFSGLVAFGGNGTRTLCVDDRVSQVQCVPVSANYFAVLGIRPALGRFIAPEYESSDTAYSPVAVISHSLWRRGFRGEADVVGRSIVLGDKALTVIGVAPPGFTGTEIGRTTDIYVPLSTFAQAAELRGSQNRWLYFLGRLERGVSWEQAQAVLQALMPGEKDTGPDAPVFTMCVFDGSQGYVSQDARTTSYPLGLFLGMAALVLVIACANIANLQLTRAVTRQKEIAVRQALGAGRRRVLRQLLIENLLLAAIGGVLGVLLAVGLDRVICAMLPRVIGGDTPPELLIHLVPGLPLRTLLFAGAISLATGVGFGLAPAMGLIRRDVVPVLKSLSEYSQQPARRWNLHSILVVGQISVAVLVTVGSGLCLRNLIGLRTMDTGYDASNIVVVDDVWDGPPVFRPEVRRLMVGLQERVDALPSVVSTSLSSNAPLNEGGWKTTVAYIEDAGDRSDKQSSWHLGIVSPGHFQTLGQTVLAGRGFTVHDGPNAAKVMVVNEAMAKQYWPNQDPVGKHVQFVKWQELREIVGVVKTVKFRSLIEGTRPVAYLPLAQVSDCAPYLLIRVGGNPGSLVEPIRKIAAELDPTIICSVGTVADQVSQLLLPQRMLTVILNSFALVGLLLAAAGIYAVMAYSVRRRIREIGIRIALGAREKDVVTPVLFRGAVLLSFGLTLGIGGSLVGGWILIHKMDRVREWDHYFLQGVSTWDPLTYVAAALVVAVVALIACYIPARRAAKVDPMVALRCE